jgi:hypothetical protein
MMTFGARRTTLRRVIALQPDFERLAPVLSDYATRPIREALDWSACAALDRAGEWYLVVFRSVRKADADEERLTAFDDRAHAEAVTAPGFVHYFKGPLTERRECLSFCLWSSRQEAREASGLPAHREAVTLIREAYERYTLEFFRVTKCTGVASFEIEPWDRVEVASSPH